MEEKLEKWWAQFFTGKEKNYNYVRTRITFLFSWCSYKDRYWSTCKKISARPLQLIYFKIIECEFACWFLTTFSGLLAHCAALGRFTGTPLCKLRSEAEGNFEIINKNTLLSKECIQNWINLRYYECNISSCSISCDPYPWAYVSILLR